MPIFVRRPNLEDDTKRRMGFWDPERQFGVPLSHGQCPHCNVRGFLKFKEYSSPRHVHDIDSDYYHSSAVYVCRKSKNLHGCGKAFSAMEESLVLKAGLPYEIFLHCPSFYFILQLGLEIFSGPCLKWCRKKARLLTLSGWCESSIPPDLSSAGIAVEISC